MLKRTGHLATSSNLHYIHTPIAATLTPSPCSQLQRQKSCHLQHRPYAMVADGHSRHDHGNLRWPELTSADAIPTPYQIFNQKKGSPYSKRRFYELVKLYHPDTHDHTRHDGLSYTTKLERYRLIVAANDILSDPIKRGAYDRWGAGWNGHPGVATHRDAWSSADGSQHWKGPQGPGQNATWEDWERWYQRDSNIQQPIYTSNSVFVIFVCVFIAIGIFGQAQLIGTNSINLLQQRDEYNEKVSKELMRRRKETLSSFGNREERIHSFLIQRDPIGPIPIRAQEDGAKGLVHVADERLCAGSSVETHASERPQSRNSE
ncbi:hypothetical protein F5884DRAFT_760754 [Xylogone sp. PMI_703]|nr:hypothetical protein F5884DRAFT_760754 [Xylogone sp. PMI_703]